MYILLTCSIPIPFLSWHEARRTCDKFLINSMAGPFSEFSDWAELHEQLNQSPAMLAQCESGGRYLHWLGYRSDLSSSTTSLILLLQVGAETKFL